MQETITLARRDLIAETLAAAAAHRAEYAESQRATLIERRKTLRRMADRAEQLHLARAFAV